MKKMRRPVSLVLTLVIGVILCIPASANGTCSEYHTEPHSFGWSDRPLESWSSLYVEENSSAWASARLQSKQGEILPVGSLGIEARLYNEDGELCASTGMRYNTNQANFVEAVSPASSDGFCSWAHIRATWFDEEGFRVSDSERVTSGDDFVVLPESHNYKFPEKLLDKLDENGYPANELGETYGSALLQGCHDAYGTTPTLIAAVGMDGVHGYVREADLNPYLATRQETLKYMSKFEENRVLPLYSKNGDVIGTFVLNGSFTSGIRAKESAKPSVTKPGAEVSTKLPKTKAELAALAKRSESRCPYQRNSKGETYGPFVMFGSVGYHPVWVTVLSLTGEDGVVRAKDFYLSKPGILPVYDLEGTVIGEFKID